VLLANSEGYTISHLVFMGMGEPLLNYTEVFNAIDQICDESTWQISKRKITVSTSGYLQGIQRLIKEERYINLAFSVGNADPLKRERIMPIEKRNPLMKVVKAIHEYQQMHNRKLTLEYTLLEDENDSPFAISGLINLAKYLNAKVNLINLNPHPKIPFKPVAISKILAIQRRIKAEKVTATVRYEKGQDITAACGQLGESHFDG
jgi:23S rRNA (adenine2503-C2)-methyltransferase